MSVADNFNYSIPSLNKSNTMYLQTITKDDAVIRPFKKMVTSRDWSANLYNLDIESSVPRRFGVFTNKTDFINKNDDIERTNPKILHYPLNKPEYNLSNKDIEKSSPMLNTLQTTRCTNPLEPKYTLPKVEDYPPEENKFIRDNIDIRDIEGTRPRKYFQWKTRETFPLDNFGIEGSKTKKKYVRKNLGGMKYDNIDYSDLTRDIFRTKRNTNPLDPVYYFKENNKNDKNNKSDNIIKEGVYQYGFIEKSKPQTLYPYFYKPGLNLKTDDIKGTNIGSKNYINKYSGKNFELTTSDIIGCNTGSLKKGIVTNRCINPLVPNYQYIGAKELEGAKFGEYSTSNNNISKNRAHSVAINNKTDINKNKTKTKIISQNDMNLNNKEEESKNQPNNNNDNININHKKCLSNGDEDFLSNKDPKMLGINDIPENNNNNDYVSKYPYPANFDGDKNGLNGGEKNKIMNKTTSDPFYNNKNNNFPKEGQVLYNMSDKQYGTENLLGGNSNYINNNTNNNRSII